MISVDVWLTNDENKVLLQRRAETTVLRGLVKPQSNPFVCQPTFNGKAEPGEEIRETIKREGREELGADFADNFSFESLEMFYKEGQYYNYRGQITKEQLKLVRLHSGATGGLILVGKQDFKNIDVLGENTDPREGIVLFPDQYNALKILLRA